MGPSVPRAMIPIANPSFDRLEHAYVTECLSSGWVSSKGPFIERFESRFAANFGAAWFGVTCSSGTAALHLALLAAGIQRGDAVLVPDITFGACINAVIHVGAVPVLVDIGAKNCSMDFWKAVAIAGKTQNLKAIIIVHLYGERPDPRLYTLGRNKKLTIIEDRAECVDFSPISGDYAVFSFYANKHITTGEGGMVVTRHPGAVRLYRDHGLTEPYVHLVPGLNYRMTNLQAALGLAQLERWDEFAGARDANLRDLNDALGGWGKWLYIVPKKPMKNVETRPIFNPLHTMSYMTQGDDFPASIALHRGYMCIPCGPHLSQADVRTIIREYKGGK